MKRAELETRAMLNFVAPSFIVSNVGVTIAFYCEKLGFDPYFREPETDPFFAIVKRDGVMIFIKHADGAVPRPNSSVHPWVKWDAYISAPDPDALAGEFASASVVLAQPLGETSEGLRGFEVRD